MSKVFYNAENLSIKNGFVRNPDRYYLEEYFEQLPRVQYKKINCVTTDNTDSDWSNATDVLKTVTNTTAQRDMVSVIIPKNSLSVGDVIHIIGSAIVTNSNAEDTSTINLKMGYNNTWNSVQDQITLISSDALNVENNDIVIVDFYIIVRKLGVFDPNVVKQASGEIAGHGIIRTDVNGSAQKSVAITPRGFFSSHDQYIGFINTWNNSNANNVIKANSFVVEIKRLEIPNNNFIIEGLAAVNSSASFSNTDEIITSTDTSGIILKYIDMNTDQAGNQPSHNTSNFIAISPNTNTNQSPWHNIKWGTNTQVEWECAISFDSGNVDQLTERSVDTMIIFAGLKETNNHTITTDNNQIYFLRSASESNWKIVISIDGVDYVSKTPVKAEENNAIYKFRISIDKSRFARVFINDIQYNITKDEGEEGSDVSEGVIPSEKLVDNINLVPFIGMDNTADGSKVIADQLKLNVHYQKISRILV